jgi:hypothetical protein
MKWNWVPKWAFYRAVLILPEFPFAASFFAFLTTLLLGGAGNTP